MEFHRFLSHLVTKTFIHVSFIYSVLTEEDADRVWSCVSNAVDMMMVAEDEE